MNDQGQLDLDGLLGGVREPTGQAHMRSPAETVEGDPKEASASNPSPRAEAPAEHSKPVGEAVEPAPAVEDAAGQDQTPEAVEPAQVAPGATTPPRLFFLTNRMNLNGVLSSRVLAPRESFHKYYADLLELAPGWVPVLAGPPPESLINRVVVERGAGAPVLVELPETILNRQLVDGPVLYLRAALLSDVKAIHFRDEGSLREHRAHGFSNIHPHGDLLQVSPELFASDTDAEVSIAPPAEATTTDWRHLDRVRGAISAALAASDSGESLAVASGLLGASGIPASTILPPWLSWGGLIGEARSPVSETDAELADRLIFQTAYRVLGEQDQADSWSPSAVLETVAADVAAARPGPGAQDVVDRNLQRVRELVNIERDFEPFRNPGSPQVAAKSLLMVLLRPDLGQLLDWPAEETGADDTTRVVAAILAGRLRGISRESVNLRNDAFDDLTGAWAVRAANGEESPLGTAQFVETEAKTMLLLDGNVLRISKPLTRA